MTRFLIIAAITTLTATQAAAIPPPVYDFCDLAIPITAPSGTYTGDPCEGENLVVDHDCATWSQTHAPEDRYEIAMPPGCSFTATVDPTGDAMLMVTAECVVYGTQFTCLASADDAGTGGTETLTYVNETGADATVWLVVDAEQVGDCGAYVMTLDTDCVVAAERREWAR